MLLYEMVATPVRGMCAYSKDLSGDLLAQSLMYLSMCHPSTFVHKGRGRVLWLVLADGIMMYD